MVIIQRKLLLRIRRFLSELSARLGLAWCFFYRQRGKVFLWWGVIIDWIGKFLLQYKLAEICWKWPLQPLQRMDIYFCGARGISAVGRGRQKHLFVSIKSRIVIRLSLTEIPQNMYHNYYCYGSGLVFYWSEAAQSGTGGTWKGSKSLSLNS